MLSKGAKMQYNIQHETMMIINAVINDSVIIVNRDEANRIYRYLEVVLKMKVFQEINSIEIRVNDLNDTHFINLLSLTLTNWSIL